MSTTKPTLQAQKMARGLKFQILKVEGCTIFVAKRKMLINSTVILQLICALVFAYANKSCR